jgi:hypothetical protein
VPPALTGESRKATRTPRKSDPIDSRAVALAAIREGVESLPIAFLDEQAHEIRVLCGYRDQLINERVKLINRLRWHLMRIAPELDAQLGPAALKRPRIRARLARQLGQLPASPDLRVAKAQLRRINELTKEQLELFDELTELVTQHAPQLLAQRSIGTVTAAVIMPHRRRATLPLRSLLRPTRRHPADPGHLRQHRPLPTAPRRRPTTQPRDPHHRAGPRRLGPHHPRLHPTQASRRQDQARGHPLPQTPHRPPNLASALQHPTTRTDTSPTHRRRPRTHAVPPLTRK